MNTACANNRRGSRFPMSVSTLVEVGKYCFLMGLILWLLARGTSELGYHWQWYRVPRFIFKVVDGQFVPGPLLQGLLVTFQIAGVSLALFFVLGVVTALMRRSRLFLFRALARFYLELIRNTPLLIQLFFIYFALSPVLGLGAFASAVLALSLFEGAYASEIFRAGIDSIHKGQWEGGPQSGVFRFSDISIRRLSPGDSLHPAAFDRTGHLPDQGLGSGEHHRHRRLDHAGAGHRIGDLSDVRNLVHGGGDLPGGHPDSLLSGEGAGTQAADAMKGFLKI